jgi:hypothetical protein
MGGAWEVLLRRQAFEDGSQLWGCYDDRVKLLVTMLCTGAISAQMTPGDLRVVKEIIPKAEEKAWQEIDWKVDLWEARQKAAKTGKPIYLWEMDGHPLGCV